MNNTKIIRIVGLLSIIIAGIISISPLFYGLDFTDTFFICCQHLYSEKISVFLPLTQMIYRLSNGVFGDHIITYRLVNWFFYLLANVIGFLLLCWNKGQRNPANLILLALAILMIPLGNSNVFAGNSLTTFFIVLAFAALYRTQSGQSHWFIILSLSLALATLSRFPNIVLYIMVVAVGLVFCPKNHYVKLFLAIISSLAIFFLTNILLQGGIHNYLNELSNSFGTMNDSVGSNHSAIALINGYLHAIKDMVSYMKLLVPICIIPLVFSLFRNKIFHYLGAIFFVLAQLAFVIAKVQLICDIHYFLLIYFYANISILIFALCILFLIQHDLKYAGLSLGVILFSICGASGSDMSLYLMAGPLLAFIPWLITTGSNQLPSSSKDDIVKMIIALILLTIGAYLYVRRGLTPISLVLIAATLIFTWIIAKKTIRLPYINVSDVHTAPIKLGISMLLALFATLTFYAINNVTFGDHSPKELNTQYNDPILKGIRTNSLSHDFYETVMADYRNDTVHNPVIFFGANSAVFSYVTHQGTIEGVDFTQDPSPMNLAKVEQALASNPTIYLCPSNPAVAAWYTLEDYAQLDSLLQNYNYTCKPKGLYNIYYPSTLEADSYEDCIQ